MATCVSRPTRCTDTTYIVHVHVCEFQINNPLALTLLGVDKTALLNRISHCVAHQLLVDGLFNGERGRNHSVLTPHVSPYL